MYLKLFICVCALQICLAAIDNNNPSPNPAPPPPPSSFDNYITVTMKYLLSIIGYKNAFVAIVASIICVAGIIIRELCEIPEANKDEEKNDLSERAQRVCRRFSLDEIRHATKRYDSDLLLGKGGFGSVYKGIIDGGKETVAVKKLKLGSKQGAREFQMEIETLSELRHINLVPLIGYCIDYGEMMLVYKYMPCGTLADHLYKNARENKDCSALTWKQRLNICIGAARGLDYLHTGHGIIHRDIKSSNILLDENLEAKVSDFGLAKPEKRSKSQSHVTTDVKGTFGYMDPNYCVTRKLTRKSDTYAFGVVLFEVLCGRPALSSKLAEDERVLVNWVQISKECIDQIVDPSLREEISPESLKIFVDVAHRCINDEPKKRPTMSQVVLQLETALERQDSKGSDDNHPLNNDDDGISSSAISSDYIHSLSDGTALSAIAEEQQSETKVASPELRSGEDDERQGQRNKTSQLGQWIPFWNRTKPPRTKTKVLQESGTYEADIIFDWFEIVVATDFKSPINSRLYMGVLPYSRQEVAVEVTSEWIKDEMILFSKLRHRNISKLLGYCNRGGFQYLVYDFVGNRNLSNFIVGENKQSLTWPVRFNIILGIARGVDYLHRNSLLRFIHGDIRPEMILLGSEMNPTICGYGYARTIKDGESQYFDFVTQIIGDIQYKPPECSGHIISPKSDVYCFGITVLEIVSGKSETYHKDKQTIEDCAWRIWSEGRERELVDESLRRGSFPEKEVLRCIQVALLCTQFNGESRPDMASVLEMLEGDVDIPRPEKRR